VRACERGRPQPWPAPPSPEQATRHQPGRIELGAGARPTHAYLFRGAAGSGKSAARPPRRQLLAEGAFDLRQARRRAPLDPSPHPDLVAAAAGRQQVEARVGDPGGEPAAGRGERRVFVSREAEAMREPERVEDAGGAAPFVT
jgi:hypothetical protein